MKAGTRAIIFLVIFSCSCNSDIVLEEEYETINGVYDVQVSEIENTCHAYEDPVDAWFEMRVMVQEKSEDNNYIVDLYIGGLNWKSVEVASDGYFIGVFDYYGIEIDTIEGTLTPDILRATIVQDLVSICALTYYLEGYRIFETLPPPEELEDR